MKESEAIEIITMIDSMNRARDPYIPAMVVSGELKNLGQLWAAELADRDAAVATEAVVALYTATASWEKSRPVTPKDFTDAVRRIEAKRRADSAPALPEAQFERKTPGWVRGKLLALAKKDARVWPEQKPGYDSLQRAYPLHRTYVWSEQVAISEEEREQYTETARKLTSPQFANVYEDVIGPLED